MSARHYIGFSRLYPALVGFDTADIGQWPAGENILFGQTRLAGEALYSVTLALTNVVTGSAWRVEELDGTAISSGTAAGSTVNVTIPYYGSDRTVRIRVRKGTAAPKYIPFETQATISSGNTASFIAQIVDSIA